MIIIELGYSDYYVIPDAMLPFLSSMIKVREVQGTWIKDDPKKLRVHIVDGEIATPEKAEEVTIASLKTDLEQRGRWYNEEKQKVTKLEAELKALKEKQ